MWFTKRFYCLFPLVCIVFHSMMMFSMVRAAPMENLAGYGDNLKDTDPLSRLMDDDYIENHVHSSNEALQQAMNEYSNVLMDTPNTAAFSNFVKFIKRHKAPVSTHEYVVNGKKKHYPDLGDTSQPILEMFFDKSGPAPALVPVKDLGDIIPLFVRNSDSDIEIYFLSSHKGGPLTVFYKFPKNRNAFGYGTMKLNP